MSITSSHYILKRISEYQLVPPLTHQVKKKECCVYLSAYLQGGTKSVAVSRSQLLLIFAINLRLKTNNFRHTYIVILQLLFLLLLLSQILAMEALTHLPAPSPDVAWLMHGLLHAQCVHLTWRTCDFSQCSNQRFRSLVEIIVYMW
jgi:hypothetical protein